MQKARDLAWPEKCPARGICNQHLAWTQPLPFDHLLIRKICDADFRANDQQSIRSQRIAQRTEAVAIELRAHHLAVGEKQRSRPVPGFLFGSAIGKELAQPRVETFVVFHAGGTRRKADSAMLEPL